MLERFDGKQIAVTTEGGEIFTGTAEVLPSGYGLAEFDRAEESVQLDDVIIFRSDIRKIGLISENGVPSVAPGQFDGLIGELLEGPYRIVDILPEQVPAHAAGQYFAVERYYLRPGRIGELRRRYAEILLRLNCYFDMAVSFDSCMSWELNPDPEAFADRVAGLSGNDFLRAVFETRRTMIDLEPCDTYMTVYDPDPELLEKLRKLAAAEGLFVWTPGEEQPETRS